MSPLDTALLIAVLTIGAVWCLGGIVMYRTLRPDLVGFPAVYITIVGGPFVWGIVLWSLITGLRRRLLARFGLENYSCCGRCEHEHSHCGTPQVAPQVGQQV